MEATDEFVVDFPTLGFLVSDWVEAHCIVPDGFRRDEPFRPYLWQLWCNANHYRIKPKAQSAGTVKADGSLVLPATAFHNRRSQIIGPQKIGKGPWAATVVCVEAVGPAVFTGWAGKDDGYACSDHGCRCGWEYPYEPGEPMGRPWPTPLIQLLATAEDQVDNVYRPLQAMARAGALSDLMRVGEEFIRLPNDGRIDVVTSSATARLGQPITFAVQDETGLYTPQNKMTKVAETQRRGAAGMGGRTLETSNAWDRSQDSTAKRTSESTATDVFKFHRMPPASLSYKNKAHRRKIHRYVYVGCEHIDLDAIEAEAAEIVVEDPGQAERFFGNRPTAGAGHAFNGDRWNELADATLVVPDKELVVIGVDGARYDDALAIVATDVVTGHQWDLYIEERPDEAPEDYEHDLTAADDAMRAACDRWDMWRTYVDPQYIEDLFNKWRGRWGDQRVLPWWTYRHRPMAHALRNYRDAQASGDLSHNGNGAQSRHIANAVKRTVNVKDDKGRFMWLIDKPEPGRKIDAAMAGALSWEARGDAIAAGAKKRREVSAFFL